MTCPTCGRPVAEGQRFCGNCGTDVQAASTLRPVQDEAATSQSAGPGGAGYDYESSADDYAPPVPRSPSMPMIALIVAAVALICLCCGMIIGGLAAYWLFPVREVPAATPTPAALLILLTV